MGVRPSLYPRLSLEDCERERLDPRPSPTRGWEKEWDLVPRMCFKKLLYLPLTMAAWTLKKRLRHKLWKIPYVLVVCWELVGTKLCFQEYITFFSDLLPFNLSRVGPSLIVSGSGNRQRAPKKTFSFLFGSENLLYGIVCRLVSDCLVSSARIWRGLKCWCIIKLQYEVF